MSKNLEEIKNLLIENQYSCVIKTTSGKTVTSREGGIKPLIGLSIKTPEALEGAAVADKVIGYAAASILVKHQVAECFGFLMSEAAIVLLERHSIPCFWKEKTEAIKNRDQSGLCPMEQLTIHLEAGEAYQALYDKFSAKLN